MGKVQDTISKIGKRAGLRASNIDIALQIPEQRPAAVGSFPTDVASVRSYLSELQSTSSDSVTEELIRALQHSNRLVNTPSIRLQITRLFEPVVREALRDLNSGYTGVDLPYPARSASDFEQATTLLKEMSASYKVILVDVLRRRGQLARKHRLPVIYQAMKYLSECGLRLSQSYQAWPNKLWRDLNTLYLCAEREQGADIELRSGDSPRTIRQLYSQCCAFSAIAGAHLPASSLFQLYRLLGRYSDAMNLVNNKSQIDSDSLYSVALDSAHPPCVARFSRYQQGQIVRFFDMEPLLRMLPVSEATDNKEQFDQPAHEGIPANQFRKVLSGKADRRHARSVRQTLLHAEAGIKEIHASLLPIAQNRATVKSTQQYGTQWMVENSSKGGLGLKWTGTGNCRVNVGELIAHCERTNQHNSTNSNWHVGIIRWVKSDGRDQLHCGVETLANYATAVTTSQAKKTALDSANSQITSEALLLNEHPAASRPSMLLVPRHLYRIGEKVLVQHAGSHSSLVKLIENYPVGGNFNCFGFQTTS